MVLVTGVVACTAAPAETVAQTEAPVDIAKPVDIGGGRTLYLECHGTGSPTVVLLSGFGNAAGIWKVALAHPPSVDAGVGTFTRVCSYDRPGSYIVTVEQNGSRVEATSADQYKGARGNAVASTTPGTGAPVVADLHRLLEAAGANASYVLVGLSLGGVFALLYARTYPEQVSGMVRVDSPTPNVREFLSAQAQVVAFAAQSEPGPSLVPGYVNERYRVDATFDEINAAGPLPKVPVTYLAATIKPDLDQFPADQKALIQEITTQNPLAEAAYVRSILGARFVEVPGTTHYVQTQRPDVVIAAIKDAVAGTTMTSTPTP